MRNFEGAMQFLKARLHEDEAAARAVKPGKSQDLERLKARVLADVEAKRQLVAWVEDNFGTALKADADVRGLPTLKKGAVHLIAAVPELLRSPVIERLVWAYASHPDYDPAWGLSEYVYEDEPDGDKLRSRTRRSTV
ncbi:DUF6221 family protein [Streptomyces stelliscabiei]|uniref:DUF6221 family protein n=1 Tax=Streptomyces stelliscabiei TaxID=146820 RepID=UPI0029B80BAB|nr:DUF6221 family protein [Streptomyces stelliscabiei]MDX2554729.1 DUF6221 family protein [Streptomyces stelliscabiei]MDX2613256.1 DUF6221 family protein [Streptomyces stelliscabiei]MDX2638468.1 DUF6221 family protein [Streptomyces stelliscabiei]MDX2661620.1 DUF6221 family protein [Streptomyces stelliscabiei]MDX2712247.1 DUF6221 family protein [Streptomyces stelliscabiei]